MTNTTKYRAQLYAAYTQSQGQFESLDKTKAHVRNLSKHLQSEVIPLLQNIPRNGAILDVGCGAGSLLDALDAQGFTNVQGIDVSADQVNLAHRLGYSNAKVAAAHETLTETDGQYDAVIAIDVIEHFTKDELVELLQQVYAALKPGGLAIFRTPNVDAPFGTAFAYGDFTHECIFNYFSAQELFTSLHFSEVRVTPSLIRMPSTALELLRRIVWPLVYVGSRIALFAMGISAKNVVLTPNLIIAVRK